MTINELIKHLEGMFDASNDIMAAMPIERKVADMMRKDQNVLLEVIELLRKISKH